MLKNTGNISEQIYLISTMQKSYVQEQLRKLGLNEIQARTLNYIYIYPGKIQKDLAKYLGKQNATITNILKLLEGKHYIKREIPSDNERQKNLYLTEDGEKAAEMIQTIFHDLEDILTNALSTSEIENIKGGLKKISDILK